ncbi:phosphatidylcholine:diacylglycerol cholinephosphotransferase 1-like [Rhodamnia argentea]|uniref:Phosphatidylcholine:diacylglycerol cholinephosphotransferase 1-like n=1 Tax=Rhodamnia argentea TaxID=178133 RepID=A0A8B8NSL6_9MYRT|nr:phosphatidylcholine:diacylglycerol cholinephosphotransferase 1-like [Rhodamnia argentea]
MSVITEHSLSSAPCCTLKHRINPLPTGPQPDHPDRKDSGMGKRSVIDDGGGAGGLGGAIYGPASFVHWTRRDVAHVARHHWIPCVFAAGLLFFMGVEYTLRMVPSSSPPFDIGFVVTRSLHRLLVSSPELNTLLAALNTVFVGMQTTYILWTWLIEGRPRATISALFMFTCRGILGYSTQLPLPQGFLGSGVDFPVGNVSFFLFFSGHVAGSVIASLDMRRMQRWELAWLFEALNVLQMVRLLGTRGHYTIDLAVGIGAGMLFDSLAGKYEEGKKMNKGGIGNGISKEARLTLS